MNTSPTYTDPAVRAAIRESATSSGVSSDWIDGMDAEANAIREENRELAAAEAADEAVADGASRTEARQIYSRTLASSGGGCGNCGHAAEDHDGRGCTAQVVVHGREGCCACSRYRAQAESRPASHERTRTEIGGSAQDDDAVTDIVTELSAEAAGLLHHRARGFRLGTVGELRQIARLADEALSAAGAAAAPAVWTLETAPEGGRAIAPIDGQDGEWHALGGGRWVLLPPHPLAGNPIVRGSAQLADWGGRLTLIPVDAVPAVTA